MEPTKSQRSQWGRIGAYTIHGMGKTNTTPARAKRRQNLERLADPEGVLTPEDRAKRVRALVMAHMERMSWKAAESRRLKRIALLLLSDERERARGGAT